MKVHFQKLLRYNEWANRRFLHCLLEHPLEHTRAYLLFSHLLTAEEVWLCRVLGADEPIQRLWQQYEASRLPQMLESNSKGWWACLAGLEDADMLKEISYKNSKGDGFHTLLADVITHMINHGTHHRGQISSILQQEKVQPPVSDYIAFLRSEEFKLIS